MIDYQVLDNSIKFYESRGYNRIEAPWTVTHAVSDITRPVFASNFSIEGKDKVLVASAEQSFLYLNLKGFLPLGKYQAITPCFRDEPFDAWHTKYFMKNELIQTDSTTVDDLINVLNDASLFFSTRLDDNVQLLQTEEKAFDLMYRDIELGSYGIRSCSFLTWIYGTGVAEPRFSAVRKLWKNI